MPWLSTRKQAYALATYWDDVVRQQPAAPVPPPAVPSDEASLVRRLQTLEAADEHRPAWQDDLLQSLLASYGEAETGQGIATAPAPPASRQRPPAARRLPSQPVRQWALPVLEIAMIVVLIVASVAGIWLASNRDDAPSRVIAPAPDVIAGFPMYRGNPARTGQTAGPGIEGQPVVIRELPIAAGGLWNPVLSGDTLYSTGGHEHEGIFAIDVRSGDVVWEITGGNWLNASALAVIDDTLYAINLVGTMVALDAATGTERWRIEGLRLQSQVQMAVADDVAYVVADDGLVYALDAGTGTTIWQRHIPGARIEFTAIGGGAVFVGTAQGQLHALNAGDGAEQWQVDVGIASSTLDGLALANNRVYVSANNPVRRVDAGFALALDATTGDVAWRVDAGPRAGFTLLAVDDRSVYLTGARGDVHIQAVDALTGTPRWSATMASPVDGHPALVDGTLYVGTFGGELYGFDAADGTELWQLGFEGEFGSTPLVAGSHLYIATNAGTLYVIAGSDSASVTSATPPSGTPPAPEGSG